MSGKIYLGKRRKNRKFWTYPTMKAETGETDQKTSTFYGTSFELQCFCNTEFWINRRQKNEIITFIGFTFG